jgi:hypothetical protein
MRVDDAEKKPKQKKEEKRRKQFFAIIVPCKYLNLLNTKQKITLSYSMLLLNLDFKLLFDDKQAIINPCQTRLTSNN